MRVNGERIDVHTLKRSEVNDRTAADICTVQSQAYYDRFNGKIGLEYIQAEEHANPNKSSHVTETKANMRRGASEHYHWGVAVNVDAKVGELAIVGFALCIAQDNKKENVLNDIFLAEMHTHPDYQRAGLGKKMARQAILSAKNDPLIRGVQHPEISLNVAEYKWGDKNNPESWYKKLGFRRISRRGKGLGGRIMHEMRAPANHVLKKLS